MAIHDLKEQIARLPEQPGVYLYANAAGETIYVGKARSLRDRVRSYLGAYWCEPEDRRPARRDRQRRRDRHRFGDGGAGAREQPDQAALAALQHPAARRQELPVPPAHHRRGVSARAGGARRRTRRPFLRRAVPARQARAADDGADPQAVRHPIVQRGHHRAARPPVPRIRHQALPRALRGRALLEGTVRPGGGRYAALPGRPESGAGRPAPRAHDGGGRRRAVRGGGGPARRHADGADHPRAAAEDGQPRVRRPGCVRRQGRPERRDRPGVPGPLRAGRGAHRVRRRGGYRHRGGEERHRGRAPAVLQRDRCRRRTCTCRRCPRRRRPSRAG